MSTILKNLRKSAAVMVVAGALAPQFVMAHGGGGGGGRSMAASMSHSMGHATRIQAANLPPVGTPPIHHHGAPLYPFGSNIGTNQGNLKALFATGNTSTAVSHTANKPLLENTPPGQSGMPHGGTTGNGTGTTGTGTTGTGTTGTGTTGTGTNGTGTTGSGNPPVGTNPPQVGNSNPTSPPISKNPPSSAPGPVGGTPSGGGTTPPPVNGQPAPPTSNPPSGYPNGGGLGGIFPSGFGGFGGGYGGGYGSGSGYGSVASAPVASAPAAAPADGVVQASYIAPSAPATGTADLVLEDLKMVEPATVVAGPAYRVTFRNQGSATAGAFEVGIFAALDNQLTDSHAVINVPSLEAGKSAEVTLRLPQSALRLVSAGGHSGFDKLAVMVDVDQKVQESDKTNNAAVVDRASLEAVR